VINDFIDKKTIINHLIVLLIACNKFYI